MSTEFNEEKQPINQVQYSAKDFPSYFDSILMRLRDEYGEEYNDFASSSVGVMFVNLMAYALDQLSWYLDRRSSESYLATARQLDSVTRLASQIGYKPKRASAASVDLDLTFPALSADAIMPSGFIFSGAGGIQFQLMTDTMLAAGQSSVTITASEGEGRTQTFTSSGDPSQIFILPGVKDKEYVADQSVRVFVNGLEWEEKDFLTYDRTNHFAVSYTTDPPRVTFGDGSAGNIPDRGAEIRIDYRIIHAEEGNVRSGTVTSSTDSLIVAGEFVNLTSVNNPLPASGGSGPQSITEIKRIAPLAFQAGGSAVTQQDYFALVNSFSDPVYGSVSKGFAAVTRNTSTDEYTRSRLNLIDLNTSQTETSVATAKADIGTAADLVSESLTRQVADSNNLETINIESIIRAGGNIQTLSVDAKNKSGNIISSMERAVEVLRELTDNIDAVGSWASDLRDALIAQGLGGDLLALLEIINNARGTRQRVEDICLSAKSDSESVKQTLSIAITSEVDSILSELAGIKTIILLNRSENTEHIVRLEAIKTEVSSALTTSSTGKLSIETALSEVKTHLDQLFDNSCKANVVTVPILVEGREGFYQAPSRGLMRALQTYLDEVKEVTHLVRVVSGDTALIPAIINLKVRYNSSFVKSEVRAEIEAGIDTLLRRRDFFDSLYVSDIYNVIELVGGIDYINITIDSPADRVNHDGNLIVGELEVVTKGAVTIEEVE